MVGFDTDGIHEARAALWRRRQQSERAVAERRAVHAIPAEVTSRDGAPVQRYTSRIGRGPDRVRYVRRRQIGNLGERQCRRIAFAAGAIHGGDSIPVQTSAGATWVAELALRSRQ